MGIKIIDNTREVLEAIKKAKERDLVIRNTFIEVNNDDVGFVTEILNVDAKGETYKD